MARRQQAEHTGSRVSAKSRRATASRQKRHSEVALPLSMQRGSEGGPDRPTTPFRPKRQSEAPQMRALALPLSRESGSDAHLPDRQERVPID